MAQKIHEWINYQPISFSNVSIQHIEHIEIKHKLFESLFLRARSLKNRQRCQFISQNYRVIIICKRSCSAYIRGQAKHVFLFVAHSARLTLSLNLKVVAQPSVMFVQFFYSTVSTEPNVVEIADNVDGFFARPL